MADTHYCDCVGEAAGLPVLQWSCVASDDVDDVMTTLSCPSDCHRHTDCSTCTSAGPLCVWSERLSQVCSRDKEAITMCCGLITLRQKCIQMPFYCS